MHPVVYSPSCACVIRLCPHPAVPASHHAHVRDLHGGCARSWMRTQLDVRTISPASLFRATQPREGRGAAGEGQAGTGGQGPGYLAGMPARLHGPHVLVQLLAELLQLPLQQHLCGQDEAGTARTPRPSGTGTGTPAATPVPHLPSAAYLNGLSPRRRHRGGGLERARGRLGVRTPRCPPASLRAGAERGPELPDFPTWCGCSSSEDFPGS